MSRGTTLVTTPASTVLVTPPTTHTAVVVAEEPRHDIVTRGIPGPPGPIGPIGPSGGSALSVTAGQDIGGHRLVLLNAQGDAIYADARQLSHAEVVVGLTVFAAVQGQSIDIVRAGIVEEPSWSWVADQPVYLGLDGVPTQTLPPGALFGLVVGFPIAPTKLFMSIKPPIVFS